MCRRDRVGDDDPPIQAQAPLRLQQTRDVGGISLGMYSAFTLGVALWLVYGFALGAWPLIVANSVTLSLALAILVMRLRFGGKRSGA